MIGNILIIFGCLVFLYAVSLHMKTYKLSAADKDFLIKYIHLHKWSIRYLIIGGLMQLLGLLLGIVL